MTRKDIYYIVSAHKRKKMARRNIFRTFLTCSLKKTAMFLLHMMLKIICEVSFCIPWKYWACKKIFYCIGWIKYKLPLLHFVGITCFNTLFNAAFVTMENEQTTAFAKALDNFAKHFKVNPTFYFNLQWRCPYWCYKQKLSKFISSFGHLAKQIYQNHCWCRVESQGP